MMTQEEAQELTKLIVRAPLSQIEAWWVRDLIVRLTQPPAGQDSATSAAGNDHQ
jgi:hypothetical protein